MPAWTRGARGAHALGKLGRARARPHIDGMVWYRAHVKLTRRAGQAGRDTVARRQIDEVDLTFVNGRAVGSSPCCARAHLRAARRRCSRPATIWSSSTCSTPTRSGGMYGPAEQARACCSRMARKIPLAGWEYQIAPRSSLPPRAPWEPTAGIGMLYNAMIAPLGQVRAARRGVVPGRIQHLDARRTLATRRCSRAHGRLAPAVRRAAAVPRRAARQLRPDRRRRRWKAAGR